MRADSLFWIELIEDTRKRRSLALKFILPVILVLPFTLDQVSSTVRHSGLPLIVLFLGILGSSVGLSNLKDRGLLERLSTLPVSHTRMVRDYLLANSVMDALQVVAPSMILLVAFELDAETIALTGIGVALCIIFANGFGVLMAAAAGSSGEVHLYSAVCVLGIAGLSGLFFAHGTGAMDIVAAGLPFGLLKDGLAGSSFGDQAGHLLASGAVTALVLAGALVWSSRLFGDRK